MATSDRRMTSCGHPRDGLQGLLNGTHPLPGRRDVACLLFLPIHGVEGIAAYQLRQEADQDVGTSQKVEAGEAAVHQEGRADLTGSRLDPGDELVEMLAITLVERARGAGVGVHGQSRRSSGRRLQPYGFLLGKQHYLVGMSPDRHPGEARLFALGQIGRVNPLQRTFLKNESFSLRRFVERSFGVFQEAPQDIVWRFAPAVANTVEEYVFHPSQSMEAQRDGSTIVRFRAGGLMEMCWHLYTWGANVEVLQPPELVKLMKSALSHRNFAIGQT